MADNVQSRKLISERLRWAREQAGLSQGQVAQRLSVHRPTISQIEAGERNVRIEEMQQLAGAGTAWTSTATDMAFRRPPTTTPRTGLMSS